MGDGRVTDSETRPQVQEEDQADAQGRKLLNQITPREDTPHSNQHLKAFHLAFQIQV